MACDSAVLRWIAAQVRMIQKRVAFLETAPDTDARASEPQTPMESGDTAWRVKSLEATVDKMEVELQSLERTLKRYDTSAVEAALPMILQGSARIELKIGGITERVNAGIAQIDERTQLLKKMDEHVNAGNDRMGQLEEDIAQINEKIRDLVDVLTVQTEPEDFGWLSSPLFDGEEVRRAKRNGERRGPKAPSRKDEKKGKRPYEHLDSGSCLIRARVVVALRFVDDGVLV